MIQIPESISFYLRDPITMTSVDTLLNRDRKTPKLDFNGTEHFELARLAAERVRFDHWRLARLILDQTWAKAIHQIYPNATIMDPIELKAADFSDYIQDMQKVWTQPFYAVFRLTRTGYLISHVHIRYLSDHIPTADIELAFDYYVKNSWGSWRRKPGKPAQDWTNKDPQDRGFIAPTGINIFRSKDSQIDEQPLFARALEGAKFVKASIGP